MRSSLLRRLGVSALLATVASCGDVVSPERSSDVPAASFKRGTKAPSAQAGSTLAETEAALRALMADLNDQVRATRDDVQALSATWLATPGSEQVGTQVFFKDTGNKNIGASWVPGDPRRFGRTDIRYTVVQASAASPNGISAADVEAAIDRGMDTWETVKCSSVDIVKVADTELDVDIIHLAFVAPLGFPVLAVTIPFAFIDGSGNFTDINRDGRADYAFAFILLAADAGVPWAIDGNIDIETVALHESGHGLGQAHFGKLFQTLSNGFFHFAPRAVMNAGYTGPQQSLKPTDLAGHCADFGNWPNK